MRFFFDRLSFMVIFLVFGSLTLFAFMLNPTDIDTGFNADSFEPDNVMVVNVTERNIVTFPEASYKIPEGEFRYYEYSWSNLTWKTKTWTMWDETTYTLWDTTTVSVNTLDVDFSFQNIFPDLFSGYNNVQTELDNAGAPSIVGSLLILFPLSIMFVVIRSVIVSW